MDVIEVRGLRVMGTHGVMAEEQVRAQPFEIDVDLHLDLRPAGQSDDVADTVDYGAVAATVDGVVGGAPVRLLERLAALIAEALLLDDRIGQVTVAVRKLHPPVPLDLGSAAVRLTRGR